MLTAAPSRSHCQGFSLIEVLVSIIVLTIGLLGASGMLLSAIRTTNESGNFSAAVNFGKELGEKTRVNKAVAIKTTTDNSYLVDWKAGDSLPGSSTAGSTCIASVCTPEQLGEWDIHDWVTRVNDVLPGSRIVICFDSTPWNTGTSTYKWDCDSSGRNLVVKISWTPRLTNEALNDVSVANRPPRVVVQLIPGQNYSDFTPVGF